jgi:hypothetical protein
MRALVGVATGLGLGLAVAVAVAKQPPPVIRNLGPYSPTPAPSPGAADRIRLVSSITVRNGPDGKSVVSFEITDLTRSVAKPEKDKKPATTYQIIATENYSLSEPKKKLAGMRDDIVGRIRDLEHDLLEFADRAGPPRERGKITDQGAPRR